MPGPPSSWVTRWVGPSRAVRARPLQPHHRDHLPRRRGHAGVEARPRIVPALVARSSRRRPVRRHGGVGPDRRPDLLLGRMYSTARSMIPDFRRNVRTMGQSLRSRHAHERGPAPEVRQLSAQGCRCSPSGAASTGSRTRCAAEFSEIARTPVQWVPRVTPGCWPVPRARRPAPPRGERPALHGRGRGPLVEALGRPTGPTAVTDPLAGSVG